MRRQLNKSWSAQKQGTQLLLKMTYMLTDRSLGELQLACGPGKAPDLCDSPKGSEPMLIQHKNILSI